MKIGLCTVIYLFSLVAHARLSESEFLGKVDRNEIAFQRGAILNTEASLTERMIQMNSVRYPNFKPQMWYYHFVAIENVGYILSYDWTGNECRLQFLNLREPSEMTKQFAEQNGRVTDKNQSIISMKYCEKLYNFYSKP